MRFPSTTCARRWPDSVATVLAKKAMRGCEQYGSKTLIVGGGFSANSQLRAKLLEVGAKHGVEVRIPQIKLCTDNGAMVAHAGREPGGERRETVRTGFRNRFRHAVDEDQHVTVVPPQQGRHARDLHFAFYRV